MLLFIEVNFKASKLPKKSKKSLTASVDITGWGPVLGVVDRTAQ